MKSVVLDRLFRPGYIIRHEVRLYVRSKTAREPASSASER